MNGALTIIIERHSVPFPRLVIFCTFIYLTLANCLIVLKLRFVQHKYCPGYDDELHSAARSLIGNFEGRGITILIAVFPGSRYYGPQ